jgi:acyl-coenzyme A synthetase/AMP-(fatty) acid ligase
MHRYMGQQVSASELEEYILHHKGVKECTVIETAAELEGELPTAVVVLKPDAHITEEELIGYVNSKVADHKKLRYTVN